MVGRIVITMLALSAAYYVALYASLAVHVYLLVRKASKWVANKG